MKNNYRKQNVKELVLFVMEDTMKKILFGFAVIFVIAACSGPKGVVEIKNGDETALESDSLEYELEVMDPKFETWYLLHDSPARYRSQQYYENWNKQYVAAWNANSLDPRKSSFFEPIIGWDPTVDYGFELNHKLFYYFMYVENVLNIQIMPGGPQAFPF